MRVALAAVVGTAALAVAPAGESALLYSTVAKGIYGNGGPPRAFVALDRAATARFSAILRPEDRPRVERVDFRRFAVVAMSFALPTLCNAFDVASIERRRDELVVTVVVGEQRGGCGQMITSAYQVVKVRRRAVTTRPRPRPVVRVVPWYGGWLRP